MWNGIDRRKFPRANYNCTITIKMKGEAPKAFTTNTENMGMGGICVVLKESFDLFKDVELELQLEDGGTPIKCAGTVVWVVKRTDPVNKDAITYDTGIEFTNIKEADKGRIAEIVKKILSSSS